MVSQDFPGATYTWRGGHTYPDKATRSRAAEVLQDEDSPEDLRAAASDVLNEFNDLKRRYPGFITKSQ